jgi:hypothetical protein
MPIKPMTRNRIRPVSTKRAKQMRLYSKARKVFLALNQGCGFGGCSSRATEIHHRRGRAQAMLLLEKYWVGLCNYHHGWVHQNIEKARTVGLICEKGLWNTP